MSQIGQVVFEIWNSPYSQVHRSELLVNKGVSFNETENDC